MLRATRPANARRINFSSILTEIDLTPREPDKGDEKKKRWRSVKTSYRFTDGLCRKRGHLPGAASNVCVICNGTCYDLDASFKIVPDGTTRKSSLLQKLFRNRSDDESRRVGTKKRQLRRPLH